MNGPVDWIQLAINYIYELTDLWSAVAQWQNAGLVIK